MPLLQRLDLVLLSVEHLGARAAHRRAGVDAVHVEEEFGRRDQRGLVVQETTGGDRERRRAHGDDERSSEAGSDTVSGKDYTPESGTLSFEAGERVKVVKIRHDGHVWERTLDWEQLANVRGAEPSPGRVPACSAPSSASKPQAKKLRKTVSFQEGDDGAKPAGAPSAGAPATTWIRRGPARVGTGATREPSRWMPRSPRFEPQPRFEREQTHEVRP